MELEKIPSTQNIERTSQNNLSHQSTIDGVEVPPGYWYSFRFLGSSMAIILMANSLFLGYVLPVNILGVINNDLGPDPNYTLITLVFTLTSGVCLLMVGRISDIVGRRWFIIGGQSIGFIGSIVCAKASSINMLIGGTVLAGVAGAIGTLYPLLIQELVPNKYRAYGQAAITLGVFPTLGFGPAIARAFVEKTALSWRWCYWTNVICSAICVILLATCYFPPNFKQLQSEMTRMQEIKKIDYGGLFLYSSGLIIVLLGFSWATGTYALGSAHVIACLVVGFGTLVVFALYEIYVPVKQPILPMKLLKNRNYVVMVIVGTVGQMVYYSLNVLWPQQIAALYTTDNTAIGWISCSTGAALAFGEVCAGPLFKLLGHARWQVMGTCIGLTAFCGMMAATNQHNEGVAITGTIIAGIFVGWVELATSVVCGLSVPPEDIGVALAFFASVRAVGGTMAASIYVAIYVNRLTTNLPAVVVPAVVGAGLPTSSVTDLFAAMTNGTAAALTSVPGINSTIIAVFGESVKTAYSASFKTVYLSSLAFGGIAILASFFGSNIDHLLTDFINKKVANDPVDFKKEEIEPVEMV